MKLVILIPALNEEQTIVEVIRSIPLALPGIDQQTAIVVNDGSTDRTAELARAAGAQVISHRRNRGLGFAFQTGLDAALSAGADVILTIDADGQFQTADIPKILQPVLEGRADVATASRFSDPALTPVMPGMKRWGNSQVANIVSFLSGQTIADVSCGFRAYSREAALNLNLFGRFSYTQESLLNLLFKGFSVVEVSVKVRGEREFGKSRVANNLWRYAFYAGNTMFRTLLDYRPLRVFGWLGLIIFVAGVTCEVFVLGHYFLTGAVSPYKTVGFTGGLLNLLGLGVVMIGLIADMINRVRMTNERTLTIVKREAYERR